MDRPQIDESIASLSTCHLEHVALNGSIVKSLVKCVKSLVKCVESFVKKFKFLVKFFLSLVKKIYLFFLNLL